MPERIRRPEPTLVTVSSAWRRYLTAVRQVDDEVYEQVEERAWRELTAELARAGRSVPDEPR